MEFLRDEIIEIKKYYLRRMNSFIRKYISEDVITNVWLPLFKDGWNDEILTKCVSDDDSWYNCINAYRKCFEIEGVDFYKKGLTKSASCDIIKTVKEREENNNDKDRDDG
jgi:hypothetical protein